jgi:hypothetical protein
MACDAAVAVAGEFPMNLFNLPAKLFILIITTLLVPFVRLVVEAAGGESAYFAGFRN